MKDTIDPLIIGVRGERVILAADLAAIYGVEPRVLNQAIKRNRERSLPDFAFQLTRSEFAAVKSQGVVALTGRASLRSQSVILKRGQHSKYPPYAFTEHGAIMAATVLSSPSAIAMSVYVVRAFVRMRHQIARNAAILQMLAEIDGTLLEHDGALRSIWLRLRPLLEPAPNRSRRRIGFHAARTE